MAGVPSAPRTPWRPKWWRVTEPGEAWRDTLPCRQGAPLGRPLSPGPAPPQPSPSPCPTACGPCSHPKVKSLRHSSEFWGNRQAQTVPPPRCRTCRQPVPRPLQSIPPFTAPGSTPTPAGLRDAVGVGDTVSDLGWCRPVAAAGERREEAPAEGREALEQERGHGREGVSAVARAGCVSPGRPLEMEPRYQRRQRRGQWRRPGRCSWFHRRIICVFFGGPGDALAPGPHYNAAADRRSCRWCPSVKQRGARLHANYICFTLNSHFRKNVRRAYVPPLTMLTKPPWLAGHGEIRERRCQARDALDGTRVPLQTSNSAGSSCLTRTRRMKGTERVVLLHHENRKPRTMPVRWVKSEPFIPSGWFRTGKASAPGFRPGQADSRGVVAAGVHLGGWGSRWCVRTGVGRSGRCRRRPRCREKMERGRGPAIHC